MPTLSHAPFNFKSILIVLFEEAAKSLVLTRRSGTPRQEWINTKGDEGSQTRCESVKQARGYGFIPDFLIFIQKFYNLQIHLLIKRQSYLNNPHQMWDSNINISKNQLIQIIYIFFSVKSVNS